MKISNLPSVNWYVLYTYPQYEKKVYNSLLKRNFNSFLPVHVVTRQWSDRKKRIEVPLFPNYVFVQANAKERFRVLDFQGVSRFISFNGSPVIVREKEIDTIKKMLEYPELIWEQDFVSGDQVLIEGGVFDGLEGVVFKRSGKSRFCVNISSINQLISVELSTEYLRKLKLN